ncbi:hypothetical protein San01_33020 [Streptomyces angustmyceticus]|uniref:Uncharacterized protein n=2 Tax=Streptomyces angustmyceticus TaxID=285578 RepID=A0A5J4LKL8_9ACTN|nr:hypothetical protein San01_33020 [Streptomyces angustmyceticus]
MFVVMKPALELMGCGYIHGERHAMTLALIRRDPRVTPLVPEKGTPAGQVCVRQQAVGLEAADHTSGVRVRDGSGLLPSWGTPGGSRTTVSEPVTP